MKSFMFMFFCLSFLIAGCSGVSESYVVNISPEFDPTMQSYAKDAVERWQQTVNDYADTHDGAYRLNFVVSVSACDNTTANICIEPTTLSWLKQVQAALPGYEPIGVTHRHLTRSYVFIPVDFVAEEGILRQNFQHEVGHALGLGHSQHVGDVMYPRCIPGNPYNVSEGDVIAYNNAR